jgi:hypothetical protein
MRTIPRFKTHAPALAAALACGALMSACGGGSSSDSGTTGATPTGLTQDVATAEVANATTTGADTASAFDAAIDTTTSLAVAVAQPSEAASSGLMHVMAAGSPSPVTGVTVNCAGGGTAVLSITGGTLATQLNGQLDAGEHYSVSFAQCANAAGSAQLNGSIEMDVVSADHGSTPSTTAVNLTATKLALTLPSGTATLDGTATASRSVVTSNGTTTTTSHVTVPSATLATAFNGRSGSFTLTDLDATRTITSVDGTVTGSQYSGHHALSGTANGRSFSLNVATTGNVSYDANGTPVSGTWTVVRPNATIATTIAAGTVIVTVDEFNDGTIDHTWSFTIAQLNAAAG